MALHGAGGAGAGGVEDGDEGVCAGEEVGAGRGEEEGVRGLVAFCLRVDEGVGCYDGGGGEGVCEADWVVAGGG